VLCCHPCLPHLVGRALAIQNSIGFAITVVSIAVATTLFDRWGLEVAWVLLPGPVLALSASIRYGKNHLFIGCVDGCGTSTAASPSCA